MTSVVLAAFAVAFHADFEGGSLGKVERVTHTHYRCAVKGESDHEGRNRQATWYYFRLDGAAGGPITIDLVAGLTPDQEKAVFSENARRLLKGDS